MKYLLIILSMSILLSGEMEVDGNLKVTGTIQNDSLAQVIANLQAQITALQNQVIQLECINGNIPVGYCDCYGNVLDICGICAGNAISEEACYTDIDGNAYYIIQIDTQIWMASNLKTTKYRDGTDIQTGYDDSEWSNLTSGAFSEYDDNSSNSDLYGNLYNWYAVDDSRGLCIEGWHVPTDDEWKNLEIYLGMCPGGQVNDYFDEGGGCVHDRGWRGDNQGLQLITGLFSALTSGYRNNSGNYSHIGELAHFWTRTYNPDPQFSLYYSYHRGLNPDHSDDIIQNSIFRNDWDNNYGFSVRCIKD